MVGMNKRLLLLIAIPLICTGLLTLIWRLDNAPVITYFAEDEQTRFVETDTTLEMMSENSRDSYDMILPSESVIDLDVYPLEDASLLVNNGQLFRIRSKWNENTDIISIQENMNAGDRNYVKTISFDHGEVHYPDDVIKIIHHMTYNKL